MTLHSISWPLLVTGTFQSAEFHPTKLDRTSNCPKDGIMFVYVSFSSFRFGKVLTT